MTSGSSSPSRLGHLEALFKGYADLPREAIVKEDILCEGLAAAPGVQADLPRVVLLEGGPYALRRTIVRCDRRDSSPYLIDHEDGHLVLRDRGSRGTLASLRGYPLPPSYAQHAFPDGRLHSAVLDLYGQAVIADSLAPSPQQVGAVAAEAFIHEIWPSGEGPLHVHLNRGGLGDTVDGVPEEEFALRYVAAIKESIANRRPILLEMAPKPAEVERRLYAEGVNGRLCNVDVWDQGLFRALCPEKAGAIGYDEWVRRVLDQVYIYGHISVLPGLVAGLELAQPGGFADVAEAVASTTQGIQFFIAHGALPCPIHWPVDPQGKQRQPPVDYYLQVDRNWYLAWQRYQAFEPSGHLMGPGRNRFPHSAAFDVGRGSPL